MKMLRDGDVCTLQMSGVTLKMSGEYRCVAVNSAGEAVCAANVAVVGQFHADRRISLIYTKQLSSFRLTRCFLVIFDN